MKWSKYTYLRAIDSRTYKYLLGNKQTHTVWQPKRKKFFFSQYFIFRLAGRKSNAKKAKTISLDSSWPNEVNKFNSYIPRDNGGGDLIIIKKKSYVGLKWKLDWDENKCWTSIWLYLMVQV